MYDIWQLWKDEARKHSFWLEASGSIGPDSESPLGRNVVVSGIIDGEFESSGKEASIEVSDLFPGFDWSLDILLGTRHTDRVKVDVSFDTIKTWRGDDTVTITMDGNSIGLGKGDDTLETSKLISRAFGGNGDDTLIFGFNAGDVDIVVKNDRMIFHDRFTDEKMTAKGFETITFADHSYTAEEMAEIFSPVAKPHIQVGGGTQTVTVNDVSPTISVIWDRVVQQAVIETGGGTGPTVASRAYAMMHTAMYDAWSSFDATAERVSFDAEGDNIVSHRGDWAKAKAMSFAAITVLQNLFPDQKALFSTVMQSQLGFPLEDDGSRVAEIGIDAAEDLLALRGDDGSNQKNGYTDTSGYTPFNPNTNETNDIARWTPESAPIDPEDGIPEQSFLTPHWQMVESFALSENVDGSTDFSAILSPPPKPFFTEAFSDAVLDFPEKTITLGSNAEIGGIFYRAGDEITVSKNLIGEVINVGFIDQALEIVNISANLTDEQKIVAEFWEDGGGTAFPPGTFMSFAQYVSARDNHSIDDDAVLFLAMGNAMMDSAIATWQAKVFFDYVRPVRAIRDLGELGLIGEMGVDENTGEAGYVIQAFGGFNQDGTGRGIQTILAENFSTFQRPNGHPSPPFAEYTSGHSGFSAAGATVLELFTGSEHFGGSVTFAPDSIQFELGVPADETTLYWETFGAAADEAGLSRRYGGIHFADGDMYGRELGAAVGTLAYERALEFANGTVADADRPFFGDVFMM